ncbi:tail fiber domain-containing protein [Arthrobacter sp. ISL-69]|uniref:tail fiber domain-containing protein n=1 Tax=Arthrobacter sp. ISL-69 TaxID=2819113 RepID=UPI001BEB2D18|nr:tail fiber domain-containing protein [Arthrobacter sp. ISL-69]MBT2537189.1 tail fiber domain-containing protein [Arthrobacter sp. ISL-69]
MVNAVLGMGYDLSQTIAKMQAQLRDLSTQPILLNASTGQDGGKGLTTDKDGLHVFNPDGTEVARLETSDGALVMFDASGSEIARYGLLTHTAAGTYGAEVLVGATWVQLGAQTSTWGTLSGIPGTYNTGNQKWAPDAHTHPGGEVTSRTAAATDAIGSQSGWTNNVGGTSFYALWVGNDTDYSFGRNVSSIRYKENVREHRTDPANVLGITPVIYDRKDTYPPVLTADGEPAEGPVLRVIGAKGEYGLIAEQVAQHCPELISWFDGNIDSVRYDLLSVQLLNVVKHQDAQIQALNQAMATLIPGYAAPGPSPVAASVPASAAPSPQPEPLPYTIQPQ